MALSGRPAPERWVALLCYSKKHDVFIDSHTDALEKMEKQADALWTRCPPECARLRLFPLHTEGTPWGRVQRTRFPCSRGDNQHFYAWGAEMINEQPRKALKMKNILSTPGINHIMHVPELCGNLIT